MNVELNTWFYTWREVKEMMENGEVWYIKKIDEENIYDFTGNDWKEFRNVPERAVRVSIDAGNSELKVVCKDGHYTTVLAKNGKEYYVTL